MHEGGKFQLEREEVLREEVHPVPNFRELDRFELLLHL